MHTTASRASTAALLRALCHWAYNPQSSPSTQMACGVACRDRTAALAVPSGLSHTGWQSAVTALLAQLCADGAAAVASDAYCALVQQDRVAGSAAPHSGACRALLSQHSLGRSARPAPGACWAHRSQIQWDSHLKPCTRPWRASSRARRTAAPSAPDRTTAQEASTLVVDIVI
jgi:hypothetical protein